MAGQGLRWIRVVCILGMVAWGSSAFAEDPITAFRTFGAKAKQSEAKVTLTHLYTMQMMHHVETDQYAGFKPLGAGTGRCKAAAIEFELVDCDKSNYKYSIVATANTFLIKAESLIGKQHGLFPGCKVADVWTMDHKKNLVNTSNAIEKCGK